MERNEIIVEMYFIQKFKQKEIAEKLKISKYIVSRVLAKDERYKEEKERRKQMSEKKHNEKKIDSVMKKRKQSQNEYEMVKNKHIQASFELSGGKNTIGNRAFRNWNPSIYKYDMKTKSYKLKSNVVTTYDVPKKLNGNRKMRLSYILVGGKMEINVNISYGEESIHNLAFIKALLIKHNIEKLNISYSQKEELRKKVLKELERLE